MPYHLGTLSTDPKNVAARQRYWARVERDGGPKKTTREWSIKARAVALELASRPNGMVLGELKAALACPERPAMKVRQAMAAAGQLFAVRDGCWAVWFVSQQAADAWAARDGDCWRRVRGADAVVGEGVRPLRERQPKPEPAPKPEKALRQAGPAPKDTGRRLVGAAWAMGPVREQGVIVGDDRIRVLEAAPICRGDMRYQVMPGERVVGAGFSALKPGQYLDDEGVRA